MSEAIDAGTAAAGAVPAPTTAGRKLKAAREAAGLSLDAVAQQLKLAPRQVKALEDDDWSRLPGRTFVRGFARNYARFVHLDPDAVLALLPSSDATPALERPALAASRRPMGEIPIDRVAKPSAARWLFPLLAIVVIGAAAYYELSRTTLHLPAFMSAAEPAKQAPATAPAPSTPQPTGTVTTTLPNPVAESAPVTTPGAGEPASTDAAAAPPNAAVVASNVAPAATGTAERPATPPSAADAATTEAPLVLSFKGTSWAEVKDARGRVVLQMTGGAGMTQTVTALAPLELSLGNAREVDVTFRGRSLDLAPYTRGTVARVALR